MADSSDTRSTPPLSAGAVVAGRFRVVRSVAEGGMGIIYRADDLTRGTPVALKIAFFGENDRRRERFRREVSALSQLRHANVVEYVSHGTMTANAGFLAMEWLEGRSMDTVIRRATLDEASTRTVAAQVSSALSSAHRHGIIHRDIKPANLVLRGGDIDRLCVVDFGVVRLAAMPDGITQEGTLVGTPAFIAPEQARGDDCIDERADLYALGAVLFTCLVGQSPFAGRHVLAVLTKLLLEPAPRVRDFRADVSATLDDLIARLLAKEPQDRPASADEVMAILAGARVTRIATAPPVDTRPLSHDERSFFSVLMIEDTAPMRGDSLPTSLMSEAERFQARVHRLANGTLVAVFATDTTPTEMSTLAARCALHIHQTHPDSMMAVATGRGRLDERAPVGDVIDRSVALLSHRRSGNGEGQDMTPIPDGASDVSSHVLVDEVTAGLIQGRFHLLDVGNNAYSLVGEAAFPGASLRLMGRETLCVGRDRELATLEAIFEECVSEPAARAILVTGSIGAGKSRVAHELIERLRSRRDDIEVWSACGDPMRSGASYDLLGQILCQAVRIAPAEPVEERQEHLRRYIGERFAGEQAQRVAAFIGELVATPFSDSDLVPLREARRDARLMYDQTMLAWIDLLDAACAQRPIICILDDLHWSDLATVRYFDAALRNLAKRGLLVVALARPEVRQRFPDLWETHHVEHIPLRPLGRQACTDLARQGLGERATDDTVARLVARCDGNPFYIEELVRGAARGELDELPDTILATVSARLRTLRAEERRLLRAASVFGNRFWLEGVAALLDEAPAVVAGQLASLGEREFVVQHRESRFPRHAEYGFRHNLLRQAAYATLTSDDQVHAHRRAGSWLESIGEPDPITLAEHYARGDADLHALPWFRRGAERALEADDMDAVKERVERAIACGAKGELLGALHLLQAEAYNWSAASEKALEHGLEAMRLLPKPLDGWANACHQVAWASAVVGDLSALDSVAEALRSDVPAAPSDAFLAAMAICAGHLIAFKRRAGPEMLAWLLQRLPQAEVPNSLLAGVVARIQGICSAFEARWGETATFMGRAVAIWHELGNQRSACHDEVNLGSALSQLGAYEDSIQVLHQCLARARRLGLNMRVFCDSSLAVALMRSGDPARAAALLEGLQEQESNRYMRAMSHIYQAQLHLINREAGRAHDGIDVVLQTIDRKTYGNVFAFAMAVRAQALLALQRPVEALAAASSGMEELAVVGLLDEGDALLRLVYAEALYANDRKSQAWDAIEQARDKLLSQAVHIDDPGWRASFIDRVVEHRRTLAVAAAWEAARDVASQGGKRLDDDADWGP